MKKVLIFTLLLLSLLSSEINVFSAEDNYNGLEELQIKNGNPIELGNVNWLRNFDQAKIKAVKEHKPILVFFQEVPGCSTASGYGERVMTHPLIIEAVESLFIPLAIYNNVGGHDREILDSFNEPSWNNPVVRIINPDQKLLSPRLSGNYTRLGLVNTMIAALKSNNTEVPQYLQILQKELSSKNTKRDNAVFSMYCFWTGEAGLGKIDGVVSTNPGFMGGREVVEVEFNPDVISYRQLVNIALEKKLSKIVFVKNRSEKEVARKLLGQESVLEVSEFRPDKEPKYYMSKTVYKYIPMLPLQESLVNSAIGNSLSPDQYLSPRQLEILSFVKANPGLKWESRIGANEITASWNDTLVIAKSS